MGLSNSSQGSAKIIDSELSDQHDTADWYSKREWLNGWSIKPHESINIAAFVKEYQNNPSKWFKVFEFLKNNDFAALKTGKHLLDGDNIFVLVNDYQTKESSEINFEAHRKYIDLQYVFEGQELMGLTDISFKENMLQEFDTQNDIEFFTAKNEKLFLASPESFFIFFPSDAHRPGINVNSNQRVRKIVVKIKAD